MASCAPALCCAKTGAVFSQQAVISCAYTAYRNKQAFATTCWASTTSRRRGAWRTRLAAATTLTAVCFRPKMPRHRGVCLDLSCDLSVSALVRLQPAHLPSRTAGILRQIENMDRQLSKLPILKSQRD
eukprot:g1865.t1